MACQKVLRAITQPVMINTDLAWRSFILAQFSAEPLRGERPTLHPLSQSVLAWLSPLINLFFPYLYTTGHEYECC